jgi:acyl carrier protein
VNSAGEFVGLVRDELGLPVTEDDLSRELHELPGWDSMHLLWLVTIIERETGRQISVVDLLEAPNLAFVYRLAAAGLEESHGR